MTDSEIVNPSPEIRPIDRLCAIMHRLRSPGGCPWDAEQTHESIIPNLIEEAYETVDAIQRSDFEHLKEELGDLLLQVVFHSEIAAQTGNFTLDDVAAGISEKLVRRHPHVFSDAAAETSDAVLLQWDEIKRSEKGAEAEAYLHNVGKGLPALMRAAKLQKKAAKVGFEWPDQSNVIAKIHEELAEVETAINQQASGSIAEEMGDLLFSVINLARVQGLDPEVTLASANAKFEKRFEMMEKQLIELGTPLGSAHAKQLQAAWTYAKLAAAP